MARTGRYQLIVLDLALPDVSGLTTLRAIRAAVPGQRVLVLSALSDVESKVRSLELGASDYMTKPFALAELIARVRARLRESAAPPSERFLRVGRVTLDLQRHAAELDGRQVSLSGREFDLLAHLMRRAEAVCSRDQLLADVWDCEFDPGTNVVDVYVRRLRLGGRRRDRDAAQCGLYVRRGVSPGRRPPGRRSPSSMPASMLAAARMAGDPVPPHLADAHDPLRVSPVVPEADRGVAGGGGGHLGDRAHARASRARRGSTNS